MRVKALPHRPASSLPLNRPPIGISSLIIRIGPWIGRLDLSAPVVGAKWPAQ
jgi:hypothetical protein